MAFLWTGSQIPIYLFGSVPYYVYEDIGGVDRYIWFIIGNLLALASVCPFVGSMSDLMGRRNVALFGATLIIVGTAIASVAQNMNIFIGKPMFLQQFPHDLPLTLQSNHVLNHTFFLSSWNGNRRCRGRNQ